MENVKETDSGDRTGAEPDWQKTILFPAAQEQDQTQPPPPSTHDHLPHLFAVSAGLMGVSLSGIGLFGIHSQMRAVASLGEEMLAMTATIFGGSCGAAYLGMRARLSGRKHLLHRFAEGLFLLGLVLMAAVCLFLAFSIP